MEVEQENIQENAISVHLAEKRTYPSAGVSCETPGMDHDAAWKRLFGLPVLIEHMLEGFARPIAERHDLGTPLQLPADSVDADARQRHGDAAWRVYFEDDSRRRSLVLLIEFQSGIDPSMATRMHGYAGAARERLRRQGASDLDGETRVLPVVLYSGRPPWHAPGAAAEVIVTADGEAWLPLSGAYLLLDANRRAGEDLPGDNLVAAVFRLNAAKTPVGMADRLRAMPRDLSAEAVRALIDWMRMVFPKRFTQTDAAEVIASLEREFPEIVKEEGVMMALAERARQWEEEYTREGFEKGLKQGLERGEKRGLEQGIEQGIELGLVRGQAQGLEQGLAAERELLCRQAARKFGAAVGDALARHLAGTSDPDRLAGIGERIVDCGTGAELLGWLDSDRDGADAQ